MMSDRFPNGDDLNRQPTEEDFIRLQATTLLYYLHESNPANGLIRDKTDPAAPASIAAVGLAQNLGAIRALATEGIQRGHMSLHARQIAIAAGASGDLVARIVQTMIEEGNIRLERAQALVDELK